MFCKITLTKVSNPYVQTILYLLQNNTKQQILGFQNTWLIYCHELIFCKWANLQKPRDWDQSWDESCRLTGQNRFPGIGAVL